VTIVPIEHHRAEPAVPVDLLDQAYRHMATARAIEQRLRSAYTQGRLRGRFLSGRGQEAIPTGAAMALEDGDVLAPVHRDLAAHLVRGTTPLTIFRHYLGRTTSPSKGRDGDLHMGEWARGVFPMVSHLPDSWPIAGGIALGFRLRNAPQVVMAFCGDGATSTGTWHESINFAAVMQLPMVLVVEDNHYAYSTPREQQYRCEQLSERGRGYGVPAHNVDGNDVVAVHRAALRAVERARTGGGPTLIVCTTMRMEGHAFHDDARYVPAELRAAWEQRDPVAACRALLVEAGADGVALAELDAALQRSVREAWDQAEAEPLPEPGAELADVYAAAAPAPRPGGLLPLPSWASQPE
jgi:TPP-dependent pyruvate/acetoin dehydrogenase alpha subunit